MLYWIRFILFIPFFLTRLYGQEALPADPEIQYKVRKSYNEKISVAYEIPQYPQYYKWIVDDSLDGKRMYEGNIPVFVWDEERNRLRRVQSIPVGTEIKIGGKVAVFLQRHFYSIPIEDPSNPNNKIGWIDGFVIKRRKGIGSVSCAFWSV